jgi:hypothetical protein
MNGTVVHLQAIELFAATCAGRIFNSLAMAIKKSGFIKVFFHT